VALEAILVGGTIGVYRGESRWWRRGKLHRAASLELSEGGSHAVLAATSACGERVELPRLSRWDADDERVCRRKGCS
jgi:hypothetical protein